ncbi:uncharacterized protein LOC133428612 [Cololabis saira]|uniref:uncharacterized protein LOC133428612 n=1 Tax=Cololabis saira TaxID=129043 RepID=UPI002AD2B843|nr:uncharacterized protein LOC133428612 [Cololabis saira]
MKRGSQILKNILRDAAGADQANGKYFCFSCEQMFDSRKFLEEHVCSSASFICSCGTEFTDYRDMKEHSTTHEPGHQVLDHVTIKKRRLDKLKAEQEQLLKLQTGGAPNMGNASSLLLVRPGLQVPHTSALLSQVPVQTVQIPQVPQLNPALSQPALHSNSIANGMKSVFAGVGAPTVDLWTLYQPVVILETDDNLKKKKLYTCAKCEQGFMSKSALITHHSLHVSDKISGCIGCGMLLSSKKMVPRYHSCNAPNNPTKCKIVTAKPLNYKPPIEAPRQNPLQATSLQQLENKNPSKGGQTFHNTPILKSQNLFIRTYDANGIRVAIPLQTQTQNPSAIQILSGVTQPSKVQNLYVSNQSNQKFPIARQKILPKKSIETPRGSDFRCRVCQLLFESPQQLQRHKCVKAREFMAKHMASGKQICRLNTVTPVIAPSSAQMNGQTNLGFSPSGSKTSQFVALNLENGKVGVSVNGAMEVVGSDDDEDCYIVESGPEKPAEMIYQVTSSVPIKT